MLIEPIRSEVADSLLKISTFNLNVPNVCVGLHTILPTSTCGLVRLFVAQQQQLQHCQRMFAHMQSSQGSNAASNRARWKSAQLAGLLASIRSVIISEWCTEETAVRHCSMILLRAG
jgi:hypothetical protein